MLHRKKPSYFREKSVKKSKNPKMLWKALKSLGLNSKERNKAKVSLKKDGTIQFEPRKNTNIFRKFYPEVAANLVEKLPITPNKFNSGTKKDYQTCISDNKRNELQLFRISKDVV